MPFDQFLCDDICRVRQITRPKNVNSMFDLLKARLFEPYALKYELRLALSTPTNEDANGKDMVGISGN